MSRASFVPFESKDIVDALMSVCTAFGRSTNPGEKEASCMVKLSSLSGAPSPQVTLLSGWVSVVETLGTESSFVF